MQCVIRLNALDENGGFYSGGGLHSDGGWPQLTNCTLTENRGGDIFCDGGGACRSSIASSGTTALTFEWTWRKIRMSRSSTPASRMSVSGPVPAT
jgi:hypothetical protein